MRNGADGREPYSRSRQGPRYWQMAATASQGTRLEVAIAKGVVDAVGSGLDAKSQLAWLQVLRAPSACA